MWNRKRRRRASFVSIAISTCTVTFLITNVVFFNNQLTSDNDHLRIELPPLDGNLDIADSGNPLNINRRRLMDMGTKMPVADNVRHMLHLGSDCDVINDISDREYVASGWTKAVYMGHYRGQTVAIKTVDMSGHDMSYCVDELGWSLLDCYGRSANKIIKEILLLQTLQHDNIVKVLGYCIPNHPFDGTKQSEISMVTELGEPIDIIHLLQMSWEDRLRVCWGLSSLINYLTLSPHGSLAINDFRRQQFVLVDGVIKLTDVDDVGLQEPQCEQDCHLTFSSANFTKRVECVEGECKTYNEQQNIFNAARHFTTFLLPHGAPTNLKPLVNTIVDGFSNISMATIQLHSTMKSLVAMYESGEYRSLDDIQTASTSVSHYQVFASADLPGQFDYRCRYSLSGEACTLSVFDASEAAMYCDADDQCRAFVVSSQRTWTGRKIAHLKNNVGVPSFNAMTTLYMKPTYEGPT